MPMQWNPCGKTYRTVFFLLPFCTSFFIFGWGLSAQVNQAGRISDAPHAAPLNPSDLHIPDTLGYVVDTRLPTTPAAGVPLVVHIQEVHADEAAQRSLSGILEHLVQRYGLTLVLVEGGSGSVDLSYLRRFGSPEHRRDVAERYLTRGLISGEEYLQLTSDYPLHLFGVEEPALYRENFKALQHTEALKPLLAPVLADVRQTVDALMPALYPDAALKLVQQTQAFDEGRLGLGEYAAALGALAAAHKISAEPYPSLKTFLRVNRLEQQLRRPGVTPEQRARLDAQLQHAADGINTLELSRELQALASALRTALLEGEPARRLDAIARRLELIEKLVARSLGPEEAERLSTLDAEALPSEWSRTLNDLLAQPRHWATASGRGPHGGAASVGGRDVAPIGDVGEGATGAARGAPHHLPARDFQRLTELQAALPVLRRFYDVAAQRDAAMVERTLTQLGQCHDPLVALITGGFHSPGITRALQARGVPVVVVAPARTGAFNEHRYQTILRCKQGLGGCEELETPREDQHE